MKAYLFSCGESTTSLAKWSLERLGLEVVLIQDPATSFHHKYMQFLEMARGEEFVVRWDADVIATREFGGLVKGFLDDLDRGEAWWWQGIGFCYLKQNIIPVSGNIMTKEAIEVGLKRMAEFAKESRPETKLTRAPEMYEPRRFYVREKFVGIHGFNQRPVDIHRVMKQKEDRNQLDLWDFDLIERLKQL